MPKPRWTTPAQRAWLEERIPAFNEAQEKGITTKIFYPQLYTAWDRAFNPQPPSAAEIKDAGGNLERAKAKKRKFMEIVSFFTKFESETDDLLFFNRGSLNGFIIWRAQPHHVAKET
jgi:hypothetical protein